MRGDRPNSWNGIPVIESAEGTSVACGNDRHPDGPWHPAASVPYSWDWPERIRQGLNRRAWGCACPAAGMFPGEAYLRDRLLIATAIQGGGAPVLDVGTTATEDARYWCVVIRRRQPGDRISLLRPNSEAKPCTAVSIGISGQAAPFWHRWLTLRPWRNLYRWHRATTGGCTIAGATLVPVEATEIDVTALRREADAWRADGDPHRGAQLDGIADAYEDTFAEAVGTPLTPPPPPPAPAPSPSPAPAPEPEEG